MEGFYSRSELLSFGFKHLGNNVLISNKASLYNKSKMSFGDNVRIDDFCILVGEVIIDDYVHIGAYTGLHASMGTISIGKYSTLSSNVAVYAASDDYSGNYMVNSMVPKEYKNIEMSDISIGRNVIVGTGSSILPGAVIPDGVAIGAMSLVKTELEPYSTYAGVPCRKIKNRSTRIQQLSEKFERER